MTHVTASPFAYAYKNLSSVKSLDFFKKLETVYPKEDGIKTVQTDNGSEFSGHFTKYLKDRNIKHVASYPKSPKVNAFVERANRTIQEEFIEGHLDYAITDIGEFNSKLMEYLMWFNTKRPHKSLGNLSPIQNILKNNPQSQMYVTHTMY